MIILGVTYTSLRIYGKLCKILQKNIQKMFAFPYIKIMKLFIYYLLFIYLLFKIILKTNLYRYFTLLLLQTYFNS